MFDRTKGALAGRRVLDLADESGAYCGKLLADLGADVIKIEPPGGDRTRALAPFLADRAGPERSLFFLYMNASKRGVTLDLTRSEDRALFLRLAATADLIVETLPPGRLAEIDLGFDRLRERNPRLVLTSISGFGQTGPHRDYRSSDLVASALGGALYVTGEADDPPVTLAGSQAYLMASAFAAASSLIALRHATESGAGQHVDISMEETTAAVTHIAGVGKWLEDGIIPGRMGTGLFASVPSGAYRCRDGLVYLMVNRPLHWKALAEWIHEATGAEAVLDPLFEGPSSNRQPYRDLLDVFISELTARLTVAEVYHEGQRRHIAFTPVQGAREVAADPQLAARGYFVEIDQPRVGKLRIPGAPYRFSETPWRISRPAPRLGEHNAEVFGGIPPFADTIDSPRPKVPPLLRGESRDEVKADAQASTAAALAGLRVIEFTAGMAGPWIGRLMAYCGADVIKVESKRYPDVTRQYVPSRTPELGIQSQLSPWFTDWNAGKRFVALELTRPEAVDLARRLVATADVVVENYTAGVMEKLGLGYDALRAVKADLVMLSSSGFGDGGPHRRYVSWGPNIEALSGLARLSGFPDRECTITQYAYPDAVSALHGLVAVMAALDHRRRTGQGQYINLAQIEATVSAVGHVLLEYLDNGREPPRRGNRSLAAAPHGCYRCKGEDRWIAIAVRDDDEWQRFSAVLDAPERARDARFATLAARLAHIDDLDRWVEGWTSARDPYQAMEVLQAAGVTAGVVQTVEDQYLRDRQLAARGFFEEIPHVKKGRVVATGIPVGLTGTPGRTLDTGRALGADNEAVFGDLLGLTAEEIRRYVDIGAIEAAGS